jgi:hypothetical protein
MSAPHLSVTWLDRDNAQVALPTGEAFNATRTDRLWSTHGNPSTDPWTFPAFDDLLTFIQERAR